MKTQGQIAQKIKQAQFRHIQKEMKRLLKRSAPNCKKNRSMDLEFGPVGVCSMDCQVCDVRFHNRAPECEDWELRHLKEEIKESLKEFFQTRTVPEIAVRFPDVAALLWVSTEEGDPQAGPLMVGIPTSSFFGIPVWTDTEDEQAQLKHALAPYLRYEETVTELRRILDAGTALLVVEKVEQLVLKQAQHERDWLAKTGEAAKLSGRIDAQAEQIRRLEGRLADVHERHRKEAMAAVAPQVDLPKSLWGKLTSWFR